MTEQPRVTERAEAEAEPPDMVSASSPAVDASTVLLLRDGEASHKGPEVLLLRRHDRSRAFAGAFVFPGGKVDPADRELDPACWTASDLPSRRHALGVDRDEEALGILVAAVRETFEEAGVLLAHRRDGTPVNDDDLQAGPLKQAREALTGVGQELDWQRCLLEEELVLDLDALHLWSWWLTPPDRPYRFDTRFFLAKAPVWQTASSDGVEVTEHAWMGPKEALHEHEAQRVSMRGPTLRNLEALLAYGRAADALKAARSGHIDTRQVIPGAGEGHR